jgi:hypothetical protein
VEVNAGIDEEDWWVSISKELTDRCISCFPLTLVTRGVLDGEEGRELMLARAREFVLVVRHAEDCERGILDRFAAWSPILLSEVHKREVFGV